MSRWIRIVGTVFALSLVFAACGDDSGSSDSSSDTTGGGGSCPSDVCMDGTAFVPDSITVSVGDEVTWTNIDGIDHTATADDGSFDSETLADGEDFSFTFDEAGEFAFHCEIHSNMTGTVVVE
jgi:plastocyanin